MQAKGDVAELNPRAAVLLESALELMDIADGEVELVLTAEDGRIRRWQTKRPPAGRTALAGFDANRLKPS